MRTYLDCFPFFLRQVLESSRITTGDEKIQRKVLNSVLSILSNIAICASPSEIALLVHQRVKGIIWESRTFIKKHRNDQQWIWLG
jgi:uncharacterized protein with ATP-grasp and redox domains